MTGPTHKQFAVQFAFIAMMIMHSSAMSQINYYLALPIVLLISKYGALFPDVDHDWSNVKEKNVPNRIINSLIRITGGHHRSWQTHSLDICLLTGLVAYFLPSILVEKIGMSQVNKEVLSLIFVGFYSGWISHLFADMLNGVGIRLFAISKFKIKFVPKHIGNFRFNTGHEGEGFCYKAARIINMALGVMCILYPVLKNDEIVKYIASVFV